MEYKIGDIIISPKGLVWHRQQKRNTKHKGAMQKSVSQEATNAQCGNQAPPSQEPRGVGRKKSHTDLVYPLQCPMHVIQRSYLLSRSLYRSFDHFLGPVLGAMMKQVCWHSRRSKAYRGLPEARGQSEAYGDSNL